MTLARATKSLTVLMIAVLVLAGCGKTPSRLELEKSQSDIVAAYPEIAKISVSPDNDSESTGDDYISVNIVLPLNSKFTNADFRKVKDIVRGNSPEFRIDLYVKWSSCKEFYCDHEVGTPEDRYHAMND